MINCWTFKSGNRVTQLRFRKKQKLGYGKKYDHTIQHSQEAVIFTRDRKLLERTPEDFRAMLSYGGHFIEMKANFGVSGFFEHGFCVCRL